MSESTEPIAINERINMRALVADWLKYNQERFQEDLDKKVYGRLGIRTTKKGVSSSRLSSGYGFEAIRRTRQLHDNWRSTQAGSGSDVSLAEYSFLLYGRFIDMGVGKGTDYALSKYQSIRKNGEMRTRRPIRWYSRRKGHELHRLRELMVEHHIDVTLDALENALTMTIETDL